MQNGERGREGDWCLTRTNSSPAPPKEPRSGSNIKAPVSLKISDD